MPIALIEQQLVLTDRGYLSLEQLYAAFVSKDTPKLAAMDKDLKFHFAELLHMSRRIADETWIRIKTDVFELQALPDHEAWLRTESGNGLVHLQDAYGNFCQFMGIFPVIYGECSGYTVGAGAWDRVEPTGQQFVYSLQPASGVVFSRSRGREAGIWSGDSQVVVTSPVDS